MRQVSLFSLNYTYYSVSKTVESQDPLWGRLVLVSLPENRNLPTNLQPWVDSAGARAGEA